MLILTLLHILLVISQGVPLCYMIKRLYAMRFLAQLHIQSFNLYINSYLCMIGFIILTIIVGLWNEYNDPVFFNVQHDGSFLVINDIQMVIMLLLQVLVLKQDIARKQKTLKIHIHIWLFECYAAMCVLGIYVFLKVNDMFYYLQAVKIVLFVAVIFLVRKMKKFHKPANLQKIDDFIHISAPLIQEDQNISKLGIYLKLKNNELYDEKTNQILYTIKITLNNPDLFGKEKTYNVRIFDQIQKSINEFFEIDRQINAKMYTHCMDTQFQSEKENIKDFLNQIQKNDFFFDADILRFLDIPPNFIKSIYQNDVKSVLRQQSSFSHTQETLKDKLLLYFQIKVIEKIKNKNQYFTIIIKPKNISHPIITKKMYYNELWQLHKKLLKLQKTFNKQLKPIQKKILKNKSNNTPENPQLEFMSSNIPDESLQDCQQQNINIKEIPPILLNAPLENLSLPSKNECNQENVTNYFSILFNCRDLHPILTPFISLPIPFIPPPFFEIKNISEEISMQEEEFEAFYLIELQIDLSQFTVQSNYQQIREDIWPQKFSLLENRCQQILSSLKKRDQEWVQWWLLKCQDIYDPTNLQIN